MTKLLKWQWTFLALAAAALTAGTVANQISSKPDGVVVQLTPGVKTQVSLFRLFPATLDAEVEFTIDGRGERPELGSLQTDDDLRGTGKQNFPNPGALVKVRVRVMETGATQIFEAQPPWGGHTTRYRRLVPFVDDGDSHLFVQQVPASAQLPLKPGRSTLLITVLEVGPPIVGEQVKLVLNAPLGFKRASQPGYEVLLLFYFWPLLALILTLYASALFVLGRPKRS